MLNQYSPGIQEGIKLHRAIDTFTDRNTVFLKTKERLRHRFAKYAPVVADVFYDHFLAKYWTEFSEIPFRKYTLEAYRHLKEYYPVMPERTQRFYDYMLQYDILFSYAKPEGIDKVMQGMARRATFESGMEHSAEELLLNYEAYENEFRAFFPQIRQHIRTFGPCRS